MSKIQWLAIVSLAITMAVAPSVRAQRSYIGYAYPAGGKQGTTFQVRLGGQGLDGVHEVRVSGTGVTAKLQAYHWQISPQDSQLLRQQLNELQRNKKPTPAQTNLIAKIEYRLRNYVQQPHNRSISSLVYVEIKIAPDAPPGEREIRVITARGPSNPLVFHVGLVPEYVRKPMRTSQRQLLGKENLALRNRPTDEAEERIKIPCTVNGQIASREVNTYRFTAPKGQRLVITTYARQLIPYIADAVPGWFQPVIALYDAQGKELAYNDDYRFKPDPVLLFEVPKDGEYVLAIFDSIYRGREDFVYRINIGDLPFISNVFPLGGRINEQVTISIRGFNINADRYTLNLAGVKPGLYPFTLGSRERQTNRVAFMVDTLPECFEKETDNNAAVQRVASPIIINGRINKTDDWDVYEFSGSAGQTVVAEVYARRLDSPLDSVLKLTDSKGKLIGFNDDCEDLSSGLDTHHADSYILAKLPDNGLYYVHIGDAGRHGGEEYAYRLRISPPRPDFALRLVPSSAGLRGKDTANVSVYAIRKDGFNGPISIGLKGTPTNFTAQAASLSASQPMTRFAIRGTSASAQQMINLHVEGRAKVDNKEIVHDAVPAEDRMQAFLWRHLVPAEEFLVTSFPYSFEPPNKRTPPTLPSSATVTKTSTSKATSSPDKKGKFSKGSVAGRLRQLRRIYEDGLFTDSFYLAKVAECEAGQ